ncbi:class I SAM-dependent methyltransferase [Rubrivirga sp. IMCC45206]|uniref:class I SAM-dependent methyltransferase n=1 Tax=Rubrivirga sp. IMCC45206 TaxID=3391614 RepID=UPI00398FA1A6
MGEWVGEGDAITPAGPPGVRRGLRARLFAWSLGHADATQRRLYADRKRPLFARIEGRDGAPPVVVEIGAGTGLNAAYLPAGARWVVVEPNVHFHDRIRAAAAAHGLALDVHAGTADALPLADGAADAVVSTLVLCSVPDVDAALAEARRVLRPGGRFVFIEHVAAPAGTARRGWQRALRAPWRAVADGCHPDRETGRHIEAAGFASVALDPFDADLFLVSPHIAGTATV